jgi:ElaB/YqjD/DUF883 family membrane-anchored ribosome-binding protein
MIKLWQIAIQSTFCHESILEKKLTKMTNKTNWPDDEQAREAFADVQESTEEALRVGGKYVRENPIPIILLALVAGAILGALLRPAPRKEPDPAQAVREWFEKALQEFIAKLPAAKKQVRSIQDDVIDRAETLRKKLHFPFR